MDKTKFHEIIKFIKIKPAIKSSQCKKYRYNKEKKRIVFEKERKYTIALQIDNQYYYISDINNDVVAIHNSIKKFRTYKKIPNTVPIKLLRTYIEYLKKNVYLLSENAFLDCRFVCIKTVEIFDNTTYSFQKFAIRFRNEFYSLNSSGTLEKIPNEMVEILETYEYAELPMGCENLIMPFNDMNLLSQQDNKALLFYQKLLKKALRKNKQIKFAYQRKHIQKNIWGIIKKIGWFLHPKKGYLKPVLAITAIITLTILLVTLI